MKNFMDEKRLETISKLAMIEIEEKDIQKYLSLVNQSIETLEALDEINVDGIEVKSYEDGNIDSIMIAVTTEDAKEINLLREIATFNVTGLPNDEIIE